MRRQMRVSVAANPKERCNSSERALGQSQEKEDSQNGLRGNTVYRYVYGFRPQLWRCPIPGIPTSVCSTIMTYRVSFFFLSRKS